jgi:hypothetical protein
MVARRIANLGEGRPPKAGEPSLFETAQISAVSQTDAAALLTNVSRGSVQNAATVQREGVPELVRAVDQGEIAVSAGQADWESAGSRSRAWARRCFREPQRSRAAFALWCGVHWS